MTSALARLIRRFGSWEPAGGVLLLVAMVLALVLDNSPLASYYDQLLETVAGFYLGQFRLEKPLLLWINDGLMAVFFLLIGLEVKRELQEGHLSKPSKMVLPGLAAFGGMVAPALVYVYFNLGDEAAMKGWAIPAATDIAFALGILSLFGSRVPGALKIFLLTVAIIDDLGAIVIIALFYTSSLSLVSLILAGLAALTLFALNRLGVRQLTPYLLLGAVMWVCVLKSGVHATLAGVVLALMIPLRRDETGHSPLLQLEHGLVPWVSFAIMPIFAFANSGVSLQGLTLDGLLAPVPLGIALGLFVGKQAGVFGMVFLAVKLRLAKLPQGLGWRHIYAVSLFTGIGFTMSLFIASLAFEQGETSYFAADRLGILMGSILSALVGVLVMRGVLGKGSTRPETEPLPD